MGQLNGGLSGFTLTHSDIGGYTNILDLDGNSYMRSEGLLQRWIEFSAFADVVMRSHPSNMPEAEQLWTNDATLVHLKKFVDIHVLLSDYKQALMREAHEKGTPVVRPMFLHFPHDKNVLEITDQFMLGENILVAPMFSVDPHGMDTRDVYLPGPASWTCLWTGMVSKITVKGWWLLDYKAPIGQIPVFYRDTESFNAEKVLGQIRPSKVKIGKRRSGDKRTKQERGIDSDEL